MTEIARRARLFLGSYVLLFVLLAIRFQTRWLVISCIVIAAVGLLDMFWIVFRVTRKTEAEPIRISDVTDAGSNVAGYLATYLLRFLTVAEPTNRDVIAYVIFVLVTGLVYVQSEMTQINPTLYILGKRVVAITTDKGWSGHLVTTSPPHVGDVVQAVPLNALVRVETAAKAAAT